MIEIRVPLEGATMADLRQFVATTADVAHDHQPFQPDYSIDHPAQLYAVLTTDHDDGGTA